MKKNEAAKSLSSKYLKSVFWTKVHLIMDIMNRDSAYLYTKRSSRKL